MGWFSDLIDSVKGARSVDFVVSPALGLGAAAAQTEVLAADQCYVELRIASLRIPKSRRFTSKLYGVIHSFTTLSRTASKDVQFASVSAPNDLANIDPANAFKAVMVDKRVMGPVAWRGGDLDIEIGLFSVVSSEMAGPFIDLISDLATAAGVSFVGAAAPFIPTIKKGVQMLAGKVGEGALEVGISRTLDAPSTGYFAIIGRDKNGFDMSKLTIDPADFKLLQNGQPVTDAPYLVYRLSRSLKRPDFGNIPELAQAYSDLVARAKDGKEDPARDQLATFRRLVLTSPDLIDDDGTALIAKAEKLIDTVFPAGKSGKVIIAMPESLSAIGLYD